ncbi:uncharacterized protein LTR77_011139 [Saxophila tyrrhenica]|uniref:Glycosyl hydrolase family 13 catalytic domain-containing protein n=1 Tax=Saxophila tyrrhenica TaxID=1690608 RepID=A0AAV9NUF4_9PEZI|nr:hypothetical protein LTR77_011139 [Saxophila tyrrhenica]
MAPTPSVPAHYQERAHYKECIVYQVYPASFCDSNGDGIGDIRGMISKLDYLKDLGVDAIWLSPIFKSPFVDNGYDISSFQEINPQFGTLEDVDELISECHKRGMKLVMDLVVNHTSDQHDWFLESRKSKDNPFRDWYFWRPPRYDSNGERQPPNNWREEFSNGSAWQWDETTGEYYLHLYAKEQPDLNWETKALRQAVYKDIMKWWLDRGADGFRMDVINLISKVPGLPNASIQDPNEKFQWPYEHCANGPRIHEFLQEMHREVLSKYSNFITVGETPFTHHDFDVLVPYVLPQNKELQMIFQFEQQEVDGYPPIVYKEYTLPEFKAITSRWQVGMQERGGWNSIYLENHDVARSVSRFGDTSTAELRTLSAKCLAALQCTLSGTLFVYQGEEIGQANLPPSWGIEEYEDIASQAYYHEELEARRQKQNTQDPDMSDIWNNVQRKARDHARSPMQWDGSKQAGFSSADKTWMRVNEDFTEWNVAKQLKEDGSVHQFWKKMIQFRKAHLACTYGIYTLLSPDDERVYAYTKEYQSEKVIVLMNFSQETITYTRVPEFGKINDWISNYPPAESRDPIVEGGEVRLKPWQAVVLSTS